MKIVSQVRRESPVGREALLRRLCETDSRLYQEIAEMLKWEERMGAFLQQPLIAVTAVGRLFRPGELLEGRFEIVRVIGEGGMGILAQANQRDCRIRWHSRTSTVSKSLRFLRSLSLIFPITSETCATISETR